MSSVVANTIYDLTEREIEILEHLNEGLKNQEIADRTGLTLYTVKWYLKQIYGKLYVSNRTEAAIKARELGLFTEDVKTTTRTMAAIKSNLPETLTPFFGRERELAHIRSRLLDADSRLVTLHGIGGMGKTRLALEVAQQSLASFADGVYFVPLAATDMHPFVLLMDVLSIQAGTKKLAEELSTYLQKKHMLIVFDNFEHLLHFAKDLHTLLENTQSVQILVTSREVLNLRGEFVIALDGLMEDGQASDAKESAAYQLFVQRAALGAIAYTPSDNDKVYIHKICQLVGGMPLAIEMAAGWASVMTAEDTYRHLQKNIDLLESDEHDRPERHQSIRATFDYSMDLLPENLQESFIKLGVFHSEGFSLKSAEAVAGLSPLGIKQLIQAALIQRDNDGRFSFHPLIRQYINIMLRSDPQLYQEARTAHAQYYVDFSQYLVDVLHNDFRLQIINEFRAEGGNMLTAWYYAVRQGQWDWLLLASEVGYVTEMAGQWDLSLKMYSETLQAVPESETLLRGRLLALRAIFEARLYLLDRLERTAREAWELLKDSEYVWDGLCAMYYLAFLKTVMGDSEGAFAILDAIEQHPIPEAYQPNAYVDSVRRIGRPATTLYAGKLEDALPLLEATNLPLWSEAVIYLPECYYLLGMTEKAHQILVHIFMASLDNKNHRLAQMSTFYLAIIENEDDEQVKAALINNLVELPRMGFDASYISRNAYFNGVTSLIRGLSTLARLSWYGCLHMLDAIGEYSSMYQYGLLIAQQLVNIRPDESVPVLMALAHDAQCPESIRRDARQLLSQFPTVPDPASLGSILDVIDQLFVR